MLGKTMNFHNYERNAWLLIIIIAWLLAILTIIIYG